MSILFISDLHLSNARPEITALFLEFLQQRASLADALYILGDLFEVWLGDDMVLPDYAEAIQAMHKLTAQGVPLYVMHGNRDFLLSETFAQQTGARLLADPSVIDLYGTPTLLMHGDTLCTDDIEYQKFRSMVRDPDWQAQLLAKTPQERLALARQYREISKNEMAGKSAEIMDVNAAAVKTAMQQHQVQQLIHGHTHRPAVHQLQLADNQDARRIVLGDWYTQGSVLECSPQGCELQTLSHSQ